MRATHFTRRDIPTRLTPERLELLGAAATAADVRAFLLHEVHLAPLFAGDGRITTQRPDRERTTEYIVCNAPMERMPRYLQVPFGSASQTKVFNHIYAAYNELKSSIECSSPLRDMWLKTFARPAPSREPPPTTPLVEVRLTPQQYVDRLRSGVALRPDERLAGVCGRICKGQKPGDFAWLAGYKRSAWGGGTCFVTGPDGLAELLGKSPLEMLRAIGYEAMYIYGLVKKGYSFELVVFPEEGAGLEPATWDGANRVICDAYNGVAALVDSHLAAVRGTSFKELQEQYGPSMYDARAKGPDCDDYMTADRLAAKGGRATPGDVRAFLYHTGGLTYLFKGDGYTYDDTGRRGMSEYLIKNAERQRLDASHRNVALGSPTLDDCMVFVCDEYADALYERDLI